jgi:hypothetical protein
VERIALAPDYLRRPPPQYPPGLGQLLSVEIQARLSAEDKLALQRLDEQIGILPFGESVEQAKAAEIIERAAKKLQGQAL